MIDIVHCRLVVTLIPQVTDFLILDPDVTLIQSVKKVALLNKAVAAGFQVQTQHCS